MAFDFTPSHRHAAQLALDAFDTAVSAAGLRHRDGQRLMAEQVAMTLAEAELGRVDALNPPPVPPKRSLAIIEAGTGVGKSMAYSAPAIALALAKETRVIISTATVALQEQLVNKDLPVLAERMGQPFRFALAKGRGRYVCRLKLERLADDNPDPHDGWGDDPMGDLFPDETTPATPQQTEAAATERLVLYRTLAQALASGHWDGDRDTLNPAPEGRDWQPVAADASSCTAKHCPLFGSCSYFEQRKQLVGAQVIVVNHDLLLSTLGTKNLPELDNSFLVLDEAHHLPLTAIDQFACHADISRLGWIDQLLSRALRVGTELAVEEVADMPAAAARCRQALQALCQLVMTHYGEALRQAEGNQWSAPRVRVPRGQLPETFAPVLDELLQASDVWMNALQATAKALRAEIKDKPDEAKRLSALYAQLGQWAPRLEGVTACAQLLAQDAHPLDEAAQVTPAKWFTMRDQGELVVIHAHASPVLPGATLRHRLWGQVRAAVLTSATLTSAGKFDYFLREVGLHGDEAVTAMQVASPFDYARQGRLRLVATDADPKQARDFNAEVVARLIHDLHTVQRGALVLFTSREQMRLATEALPASLRGRVQVQNQLPRPLLLAQHRERVADGKPSIVFGMQSFGEGLDLPGALCEDLFILKLPFSPPDDPVGEARAEWVRSQGRDPFMELVVPSTAMRLAQWVGRAIRTEEDEAHVHCYDRRLSQTHYGRLLLQSLPPFARVEA